VERQVDLRSILVELWFSGPSAMSFSLFLGAGFSKIAGLPLAAELFDTEPEVDRLVSARLVLSAVEGMEGALSRGTGGIPCIT